jgi:hypothetical protein
MRNTDRARNQALLHFIVTPVAFLTVALLGGLRISADTHEFLFVPPPLITLILALLMMLLFASGRLIDYRSWLSLDQAPTTVVSHALTLLSLFFASAQAFNSALPEGGLLHWLFSFFFLWTLWNNLFSIFDPKRLTRSLGVLFGTAFVLKHLLLATLYAPDSGWLRRLTGTLVEGLTLGSLDTTPYAPATGYISFFTLVLFVGSLLLVPQAPFDTTPDQQDHRLPASDSAPFELESGIVEGDVSASEMKVVPSKTRH